MALTSFSWLLRSASFCHLAMLLAGQHFGVNKCSIKCSGMTNKMIPLQLLVHYQLPQGSCGQNVVILKTRKQKLFCADSNEEWVREAMDYLNRRADLLGQNGGKFEKQIGMSEPRTTLATRGMDGSAVSETKVTSESSSQEARRAFGTSPGLPTGAADSRGTRFPSTSKSPDGGPETTELSNGAAITTATSWQSSSYHRGQAPGLRRKPLKPPPPRPPHPDPPPQAPPPRPPPPRPPDPPHPGPLHPDPPHPGPLHPDPSHPDPPHPGPLYPGPLHPDPPHPGPPTQAPSTQAPTISYTVPEDYVGSEPLWIKGQDPTPENSLGPKEVGPPSAPMDAFMGPGNVSDVFVVSASSEGSPSTDPSASGRAPKAKEPMHATMDPQRLGVLSTSIPDSHAATRRQAVGLLAFLGLLFFLGVAMFAYQSLQGCSRKMSGDMAEGLCYVPRSCGSNSYVLVPV
uniref:Chemokine interleukin-8-like domain-containing protein n=1 Tax=Sus scrofa TaxID=9823 RepID=I3L9Z6_PIG